MARIGWLLLLTHMISACKTSSEPSSFAASRPPEMAIAEPIAKEKKSLEVTDAPLSTCKNLKSQCPVEERNLPYQCVAYRLAGKLLWQNERVYAWGPSLCQARHSLLIQACQQNLEPERLGDIHCGPDSSAGSCPVLSKNCPSQGKASRCIANRYKSQEIPWSERPIAWAVNECKAREKLLVSACHQGLDPKDIEDISCEADPSPGSCPPKAPVCDESSSVPTTCQVSTIGDVSLKKAWVTQGATACEAQFRLKELACRFADAAKKLTPEQLGSMECRSFNAQL